MQLLGALPPEPDAETTKPGRLTGVPGPGAGPTEIRSGIHGIRRGPAKKKCRNGRNLFVFFYYPEQRKTFPSSRGKENSATASSFNNQPGEPILVLSIFLAW
jgi:hypothetical protein